MTRQQPVEPLAKGAPLPRPWPMPTGSTLPGPTHPAPPPLPNPALDNYLKSGRVKADPPRAVWAWVQCVSLLVWMLGVTILLLAALWR